MFFVYVWQCVGVVVLPTCVTISTTFTGNKVVVASEEYFIDWTYNVVKKYIIVYITVSVYFWSLNVHIFLFLLQTPSLTTASGLTLHHSYYKLRNKEKKFSCGKFINILSFQIVLKVLLNYDDQTFCTEV